MNNTILSIIIIVAFLSLYYFLFHTKESMTNVSFEQQTINNIYIYISNNPDITFADYINFLISIKNTNLHLIDNQKFLSFKILQKRNLFVKNDIENAMKS